MSFDIAIKSPFMADIVRLDGEMKRRIWDVVDDIKKTPISPRGDTVKKLSHHDRLWRYRIGDYRLVYAVYPESNLVQLVALGPRKEIYERLHYEPNEPEYAKYAAILEQSLNPNEETPAEWSRYASLAQSIDSSRTLPYRLTPKQLDDWHIPFEFHSILQGCETDDQLLECGAPQEIILHLVDCLWPPDAATVVQSPNLLVGSTDDLKRYAAGDLIGFLLLLDDDQKNLVDFGLRGTSSGPILIKGGPGSGKSTVALYRVKILVENNARSLVPATILFTTYTNALITASRQLIDRLLETVTTDIKPEVSTLDLVAKRIVYGDKGRAPVAESGDIKMSITSARTAYKPEGKDPLQELLIQRGLDALRDDYLIEEFEWIIEGRGLRNLQSYLSTDRTGRGYAFDERLRRAIWQLYEHSRKFIHNLRKITWGELRQKALDKVRSREWAKRYDYVLVDEAQDLTPIALSLALELCVSPAGLFLTADACQSIYNRGFTWKNVHENLRVTGRTRLLKRNYRTTRQIVSGASDLLRQGGSTDEEALAQFFVHAGSLPKIYAANSEDEQFLWLAHQIQSAARELRVPIGSTAVLAPTNDLAQLAATRLTNLGVPTDYMQGRDLNLKTPHAKALTIHSCKGLEFPIVAVPFVEEGRIPKSLLDERADDLDNYLQQELRLLFVGCTRAMRRLLVTYSKDNASRFVQNINAELWDVS